MVLLQEQNPTWDLQPEKTHQWGTSAHIPRLRKPPCFQAMGPGRSCLAGPMVTTGKSPNIGISYDMMCHDPSVVP